VAGAEAEGAAIDEALVSETGAGELPTGIPGEPEPVVSVPQNGDGFNYRGIGEGHPKLDAARAGRIEPGNVDGPITAEDHNMYGDSADVQANSPFTSWTPDPVRAAERAGTNGVLLRVPQGAPPPGASWSWVFSPDEFAEGEVLLKGPREGAEVIDVEMVKRLLGLR
jgi:hypothetical protein